MYDGDGTIRENLISKNRVLGECSSNYVPYHAFVDCGHGIGGGLFGCDGLIQNNLVVANSCEGECLTLEFFDGSTDSACNESQGGALYDCKAKIQNNTIFGNSAFALGGGIADCEGTVTNNVIWLNEAPEDEQVAASTPTYSCIQDWTGGVEGNISDDPLFLELENEDFRIPSDSPCVDAVQFIDGLITDFDGNPRSIDGVSVPRGDGSDFDIGAFEYQLFKKSGRRSLAGPQDQ